MKEAVQYLFVIGVAIAGVGLTLLFQGLALKKPQRTNCIGNWAIALGVIWIGMGGYALYVLLQLFVKGG